MTNLTIFIRLQLELYTCTFETNAMLSNSYMTYNSVNPQLMRIWCARQSWFHWRKQLQII